MFEQEELSPYFTLCMAIFSPFLFVAPLTIAVAMNAAFPRICYQKDVGSVNADDYFFY
ncbi:hypothetical protein [Pareuzebyella sediminis]|uniref:hypothetical protein n=1 Tax=Pareuzebyella sediminis TaxID=2607998 RepID=UPI0018E1A890|nr:hypothetical protein [Pareuzebyella sediminis]